MVRLIAGQVVGGTLLHGKTWPERGKTGTREHPSKVWRPKLQWGRKSEDRWCWEEIKRVGRFHVPVVLLLCYWTSKSPDEGQQQSHHPTPTLKPSRPKSYVTRNAPRIISRYHPPRLENQDKGNKPRGDWPSKVSTKSVHNKAQL